MLSAEFNIELVVFGNEEAKHLPSFKFQLDALLSTGGDVD
jgi:hypothetical protein